MTVTTYTSNGTPSDATGVQGDMNIDYGGRFLWGPKGSSSWVGTASSIVGPTGAIGAAGPQATLPVMGNFASGFGPACNFSATTLAAAATPIYFAGSAMNNTYNPLFASALTGYGIVNYGSSKGAITCSLNDLTLGTTLYTTASITAGSLTSLSLGNTAYPMIAGHNYQWSVTPAAAGAYTVQLNPIYLMPSSIASGLSVYTPGSVLSSTTASSGGTVWANPPGFPGSTLYYKNANASYLYYVSVTVAGSGVTLAYLYNGTSSANQWVAATTITLTTTPTTYTYGPFAANTWPFAANSYYEMGLYCDTSTAINITSAFFQITVGQ